ncbi:MAG: S8 family serine peptidase [Candidatus Methylomirabilis oxyfera]|nr:S8 family serine peptidase [Candidatus Methylomirabilis oxyfera]
MMRCRAITLMLVVLISLAMASTAWAALSVTASPTSVVVGQPVSVTVSSSGCSAALITVNFGDSTSTTVLSNTTTTVSHAYLTPGSFSITANGTLAFCTPATAVGPTITVSSLGAITSLSALPSAAVVGQAVIFTVSGTGTCGSLTLNFGDATSTTLSGAFPLTTTHAYASPGTFTATATGTSSCTGSASTLVTVTSPPGAITSLTATPSFAQVGQAVIFTVSGTGTCGSLTLNFGDATSTTLSGVFPRTASHAYSSVGTFTATATGTSSCTGSASAIVTIVPLPPLSVAVSVNTTPSPAQVSLIQSVPVVITYTFTTNIQGAFTLTSSGGTFVAGSGGTLGTGGSGLSVTITGGRGVVTESLIVPQVVAERSLRGGSPTFTFQRTFSSGNISVPATVPMRVVSSAAGPFSLRRVELRFDNGRGEITVPKHFEHLKAVAFVEFNGSGLLEAAWEVDGRTLAIIRKFLTFGDLVTLTTPDVPPLPTFEPGPHRITFRITSPPSTFEIPPITYFVTAASKAAETIELIAPADKARWPQPGAAFEWKGVAEVAQYRLEIIEAEEDTPSFSALVKETRYSMPPVYERNLVIGKRYRWQVKGLDVNGNVVAVSQSRTFTWSPDPPAGVFVPGQVLAALKAGPVKAASEVVKGLERRFNLRALRTFELKSLETTVTVFEVPASGSIGSIIFALQADPRILFAQPNYLSQTAAVHTDPLASLQYGPRAIRADQVHGRATGRGIRVAVVDTGIDVRHPDLRGRVVERVNFAPGEERFEEEVHGTLIAGVIAARADNGMGIYGIAPEVELMAIRACRAAAKDRPEGVCTSEGIARGIDYALMNDARVINLSLGGPADLLLPRLVDRARQLGTVIVAAAGNTGPTGRALYPAVLPTVIAVTAVDARDGVYSQATRGEFIDLAAPGVEVMTTMPGAQFGVQSGTSLAAAHVSGVVALLLQVSPRISPEEVQHVLEETAEDLGAPGKDRLFGSGRVDACRAIRRSVGSSLVCR